MHLLPTITSKTKSGWRDKLEEAEKLGLKEIALFPTTLPPDERKELYQMLEKTGIEKIPFVHLRSDMELWELDYLIEKYQTKIFNTHTAREYPFQYNWDKYKGMIYIENTFEPLDESEIREFAGVCVDLSHLENARVFKPKLYEHNVKLIKKYPVGCSHVSPSKNFPMLESKEMFLPEEPHFMKNLSELDYLKRYPLEYFGRLTAMEFENSIEVQLKAIQHIKKLFKERG